MSRIRKGVAWLVLLAVVAAPTAALVAALWRPARSVPATAVLEIAHEPPILLFETAAWRQEARIPYKDVVQSEMQRIKRDRVLRRALRILQDSGKPWRAIVGNDEPPVDWLKRNLEVTSSGTFVLVSLRGGPAPADRAEIVNAVVEAYISDIREERNAQRSRISEVSRLREQYENKLRAYRRNLDVLLGRGIAPSDPATGRLAPEQWKRLAERTLADLTRVEGELREALAEKVAGAKHATASSSGPDLDRRIAVLEEQSRMTREDAVRYAHEVAEYAREAAKNVSEVAALRDEARRTEEMLTAIDRELMRMEVEMDAPDRIRIVDQAMPSSR